MGHLGARACTGWAGGVTRSVKNLVSFGALGPQGGGVTPFKVAYYMYGAYYTMATFSQSGLGLVVYS